MIDSFTGFVCVFLLRADFGSKTSRRRYYFLMIQEDFLLKDLCLEGCVDETLAALRAHFEGSSHSWPGPHMTILLQEFFQTNPEHGGSFYTIFK